MNRNHRSALTLVELVIIIAVLVLLAGLLLSFIPRLREDARRMQCSGHLKQLVLALHNYHDVYFSLPFGAAPCSRTGDHAYRYSVFVSLTPFFEASNWYNTFITAGGRDDPWTTGVGSIWCDDSSLFSVLRCPSDPFARTEPSQINRISYRVSLGDWVDRADQANVPNPRGAFSLQRDVHRKFSDFFDGMSNTVILGEAAVGSRTKRVRGAAALGITGIPKFGERPDMVFRAKDCLDTVEGRRFRDTVTMASDRIGHRWGDANAIYTGFSTILPPNGPSCSSASSGFETDEENTVVDGEVRANFATLVTASSYHPGGVNIAYADGAVRFLSNDIDTGGSAAVWEQPCVSGGTSPYGIWGELGSFNNAPLRPVE